MNAAHAQPEGAQLFRTVRKFSVFHPLFSLSL